MTKHFSLGFVLPWAWLCLTIPAIAQTHATLNRLAIRGSEQGIEVEVTSSQPVGTETQVLTGPDRLVVDFPGTTPGSQVRGITVNQGGIKAVRVSLFQSNPPVTRVVLDLQGPSAYQLVPNGNAVVVKLGAPASPAPAVAAVPAGATVQIERHPITPSAAAVRSPFVPPPAATPPPPAPPPPHVQVSYRNGLLSISAEKASLAEVLYEIHLRTGADIPIPAGAEREKVIVKTGPAPANQAMATLLNGTSFNFVLVGSDQDANAVKSVILTPRGEMGVSQPIGQPMGQAVQQPVAPNEVPPPEAVPENTPDMPQVEEEAPPQPAPGQGAPDQQAPTQTGPGQATPQLAPPSSPPAPPMQPDPNSPPVPPEPPPD